MVIGVTFELGGMRKLTNGLARGLKKLKHAPKKYQITTNLIKIDLYIIVNLLLTRILIID